MAEYIDKRKAQMELCNLPATLDAEAVQRCIETVHNLPAADVRESDLKIWCAECAFLSEPEECEECRDGFELGSMPTHWTPSRKVKKPTTNADLIRAMSDEELAEYLSKVQGDIFRGEMRLTPQWFDWLRQEVDNGKDD